MKIETEIEWYEVRDRYPHMSKQGCIDFLEDYEEWLKLYLRTSLYEYGLSDAVEEFEAVKRKATS